jgi:hypothetical protein
VEVQKGGLSSFEQGVPLGALNRTPALYATRTMRTRDYDSRGVGALTDEQGVALEELKRTTLCSEVYRLHCTKAAPNDSRGVGALVEVQKGGLGRLEQGVALEAAPQAWGATARRLHPRSVHVGAHLGVI